MNKRTIRDHASFCSITGCAKKPVNGRGWCSAHYHRWQAHGDPNAGRKTMNGEPKRFFDNVVSRYSGDECLGWPFADDGKGYGVINIDRRVHYVHRMACEIVNGPAPTPFHKAAHSCGKGHEGCCAPNHLSWKTQKDNVSDAIRHGTTTRGERHALAKLTADQVREIRGLDGLLTQKEIASRYQISRSSISLILSRKNWSWLDA